MATITRADPSPLFPNKIRVTLDGALNMFTWLNDALFRLANSNWVADHSNEPAQSAMGDQMDGQHPAIVPGSSDMQFEVAFGSQGPNIGSVAYGWNLDETSGDTCSGSIDLTALGADPDGVEIIDGAWQKARRFSGDTAEVLQSDAQPGGFGIHQECTIAAIVYLEGGRTDPATIFSVQGDPSNVADGADNEQFRIEVETDGRITWAWEHGTRVEETGTTDKQLTNLRAALVTVVRRNGVSDYDVDVYVNGDLWQTWTGITGPDGGDSADMRIGIGRQAVDTVNPFKGMIDQPQLLTEAVSQSTLLAAVKASILPLPLNVPLTVTVDGWRDIGNTPASLSFITMTFHAVDYAGHATLSTDSSSFESIRTPDGSRNSDATPPVVDNVDPPQDSAIVPRQVVSFDVTDDTGLFRRILVAALFSNGIYEVVHDGDNWGPAYTVASNTKEAIADGFHFAVLRNGGWPAPPTIRVFAIDQGGGEG